MHSDDTPRGGFPALPFNDVIVVDSETTGLDPAPDGGDADGPHRICALSLRWLHRDEDGAWSIVQPQLYWSFNPQRPVPDGAARVNGFWWSGEGGEPPIDRNDLRDKPVFAAIADYVRDAMPEGVPIVCHNAPFDRAFLDAEFVASGREPLANPSVCTKAAFADMQGLGRPREYVRGTSLDLLCDRLGIVRDDRLGEGGHGEHGAAADTLLAARCFMRLDALGWIEAEDPALLPHRLPRPSSAAPGL